MDILGLYGGILGLSGVYLKISGENLRGIWGMLMRWFGDCVYH